MKRSVSHLIGCTVHATDGDIGRVQEFYFDDHKWTIRYMVVNTGRWLAGRQVLIPTDVLGKPDWESRIFPVNLTKQRVKNSPDIDTHKPFVRQHEAELRDYYESPIYWAMGLESYVAPETPADPHLRTTHRLTGFHVQATDGALGHVEDFIVEDDTWIIRYLVVNTRNGLRGKKVLIHTQWIKEVNWSKSKVVMDLSQELVMNSPALDLTKPVTRDDECRLFDHYKRPKYWEDQKLTRPARPQISGATRQARPKSPVQTEE